MGFTVKDFPDLIRLLREHEEWREQLRMLILTEELLRLPLEFRAFRDEIFESFRRETEARFQQLAEAQRRTEERVEQLAEAQRRTEERVGRLEEAVAALAEAQRRTEERVEQLAEAQRRTEERVGRLEEAVAALAEAQRRTEERVEQLAEAQRRTEEQLRKLGEMVAALAEAQRRTEERLDRMEQRILRRLNAFGARWGLRSEAAWREGMRAVLQDIGFQVERWTASDPEGEVFGYPATVELDVVIRNGVVMVIELKASAGRETLPTLERKVRFYEKHTGRSVQRRILVTPWYEPGVAEQARWMGWELYGEPEEIIGE